MDPGWLQPGGAPAAGPRCQPQLPRPPSAAASVPLAPTARKLLSRAPARRPLPPPNGGDQTAVWAMPPTRAARDGCRVLSGAEAETEPGLKRRRLDGFGKKLRDVPACHGRRRPQCAFVGAQPAGPRRHAAVCGMHGALAGRAGSAGVPRPPGGPPGGLAHSLGCEVGTAPTHPTAWRHPWRRCARRPGGPARWRRQSGS